MMTRLNYYNKWVFVDFDIAYIDLLNSVIELKNAMRNTKKGCVAYTILENNFDLIKEYYPELVFI